MTRSLSLFLLGVCVWMLSSFVSAQETRKSRPSAGFTPEQKRRADQIISVFENDTPTIQYDYTEVLGDGRGLTAGRAGFTTATGDLLLVVERYTSRKKDNPLATFLPRLREVAKQASATMEGLDGIEAAWKDAAKDALFRTIQDNVTEELYYRPAVVHWKAAGMKTALGLLILYDTIVQHGEGKDPDGLPALLERAKKQSGVPGSPLEEKAWLLAFLKLRRETLANATDPATRKAWAESVVRCDVLMKLVNEGNEQLEAPLVIAPYGHAHTLP